MKIPISEIEYIAQLDKVEIEHATNSMISISNIGNTDIKTFSLNKEYKWKLKVESDFVQYFLLLSKNDNKVDFTGIFNQRILLATDGRIGLSHYEEYDEEAFAIDKYYSASIFEDHNEKLLLVLAPQI